MTEKILTEELKKYYISQVEPAIRKRIAGFSVSEVQIVEAIYYDARELWEADGYIDSPTSYVNIKERQNKLFDKLFGK